MDEKNYIISRDEGCGVMTLINKTTRSSLKLDARDNWEIKSIIEADVGKRFGDDTMPEFLQSWLIEISDTAKADITALAMKMHKPVRRKKIIQPDEQPTVNEHTSQSQSKDIIDILFGLA